MEKVNSSETLKVYYDGLCHLCSREINHYKRMRGSENILFIDITTPDFKAEVEGLDPVLIHKSIHVRSRSGEILTGVNAFIGIWSELPALNFLVPLARLAPVHAVLKILYATFAAIRPLLPRKSCELSPYCAPSQK